LKNRKRIHQIMHSIHQVVRLIECQCLFCHCIGI
jgi:hypothetical protein